MMVCLLGRRVLLVRRMIVIIRVRGTRGMRGMHCMVSMRHGRIRLGPLRPAKRHGRGRISLERDCKHRKPQQNYAKAGHARILSASLDAGGTRKRRKD